VARELDALPDGQAGLQLGEQRIALRHELPQLRGRRLRLAPGGLGRRGGLQLLHLHVQLAHGLLERERVLERVVLRLGAGHGAGW
jgi:hypothetical protein